MSKCIHCKTSEGTYPFRVIEIQTLHVRDISGEKYVQAMGKTADYSICSSCARQYISESSSFGGKYLKRLIPAAALILFGIVYTIFQNFEIAYMRMLGPIAVLCGLLLIYAAVKEYREQKKSFEGLNGDEALKQAAWMQLIDTLPRKNEDQDITYVPVNGASKGMSIKQLSENYDLLPAIAKQVKAELAKN